MLAAARIRELIRLLLKHRCDRDYRYVRVLTTIFLSLWLQRYIRTEDHLYRSRVQGIEIPEAPLFIIGHWRSGTTYLHYLLALDSAQFAHATNYQCLFPTVFLTLDEDSGFYKLVKHIFGRRTRLIDNVEVEIHSPQEDEWMYLPEGGFSYSSEQIFFPNTVVSDIDEVLHLSTNRQSEELTLKIFEKLTYQYRKRMISKSPGHCFRIGLLKKLFPTSKFIFLIRHPYKIVPSMMRMEEILRQKFSLHKRSHNDLYSGAQFLSSYYNHLRKQIVLLNPQEFLFIKYEKLVEDPVATILSIYNTLDIPYTDQYHQILIRYVQSLHGYQTNTLQIDEDTKHVIYTACRHIFETYGYVP